MDDPDIVEEFCNRPHLGPRHERHRWSWSGHRLRCLGYDPNAPIAPELTVDLLIAKYEGRQEGLRAKLRGHDLGYYERQTVQSRADETNDFLTDLHRLRTTNQNGA